VRPGQTNRFNDGAGELGNFVFLAGPAMMGKGWCPCDQRGEEERMGALAIPPFMALRLDH
jgi:hypothetical protein